MSYFWVGVIESVIVNGWLSPLLRSFMGVVWTVMEMVVVVLVVVLSSFLLIFLASCSQILEI